MTHPSLGPAALGPAGLSPAQAVLQFLESVGQRSEAEIYLRLYRSLPLGRFALVVPSARALRESGGALSEQLAFLRHLGLYASVVIGAIDAVESEPLEWFLEAMQGEELSPVVLHPEEPGALDAADGLLRGGRFPVFVLQAPSEAGLADVVRAVSPRKVLFLRAAGGLGPSGGSRIELSPGHFLPVHESGIGVINLRSDERPLLEGAFLSETDEPWLGRSRRVLEALEAKAVTTSTVSIASPLSLLQELFTVRGEGTLVKLGAQIESYERYDDVDLVRLASLIGESFGRPVLPRLFQRVPLSIHLEREYRGLALVEPGLEDIGYLTKFAVLPVARGEGLGQDLWWSVARRHPRFYWRSRTDNPINSWYATVCDGMQRTEEWNVYWRGVGVERVPSLVNDALRRPRDLVEPR